MPTTTTAKSSKYAERPNRLTPRTKSNFRSRFKFFLVKGFYSYFRRNEDTLGEARNSTIEMGARKTDRTALAAAVVLANNGVAFAGKFFELFAVQNFQHAARVRNNLFFLENAGGDGDARAVRSQHGGEVIVRDRDNAGIDAVLRD